MEASAQATAPVQAAAPLPVAAAAAAAAVAAAAAAAAPPSVQATIMQVRQQITDVLAKLSNLDSQKDALGRQKVYLEGVLAGLMLQASGTPQVR
jgi:hypothetical protein